MCVRDSELTGWGVGEGVLIFWIMVFGAVGVFVVFAGFIRGFGLVGGIEVVRRIGLVGFLSLRSHYVFPHPNPLPEGEGA